MAGQANEPGSGNHTYVDTPLRVRYADTDKMGVVYYGTYPVYFEVGRSEFMREKGFSYRDFEEMGFLLVVVGLEAKYISSAVYDDLLTIRTRIAEVRSRGVTFHYEIYRDGGLVVEGKTRHICLDRNRRPVVIPDSLLHILKDAKA